jgi:hypothetical protein
MLSARERHFIDTRRVAHLATADSQAVPQVVPVCFGLAEEGLYITIDRKPKRDGGRPLKRLRNIAENPAWPSCSTATTRTGSASFGDAARPGRDPDRRRRARRAQSLLRARSAQGQRSASFPL